jgi:hypothetical protein
MKQTRKTKKIDKIQKICSDCASTSVLVHANKKWDFNKQEWIDREISSFGYCENCEASVFITDVKTNIGFGFM